MIYSFHARERGTDAKMPTSLKFLNCKIAICVLNVSDQHLELVQKKWVVALSSDFVHACKDIKVRKGQFNKYLNKVW